MNDETFKRMMSTPKDRKRSYITPSSDDHLKQDLRNQTQHGHQPAKPVKAQHEPPKPLVIKQRPLDPESLNDLRQWDLHLKYAERERWFIWLVLKVCICFTLATFFIVYTRIPLILGPNGLNTWINFDTVIIVSIIPQLLYWFHCNNRVRTYKKIINDIEQEEGE